MALWTFRRASDVDLTDLDDPLYRRDVTGSAAMSGSSPHEQRTPADLAAGVPYAYAAVTRGRPLLVFTAGACPLDASGSTVAPGDVAAQAETVMANLRSALQAAGARLDDVVKTTVYVASDDRADLVAAWRVVHRHFGSHEPPSTLLGVRVLGYPEQLVEVEAIAALVG
jgi:enamine deaminase RidA (YjgF/YER057c/UK114 family)